MTRCGDESTGRVVREMELRQTDGASHYSVVGIPGSSQAELIIADWSCQSKNETVH